MALMAARGESALVTGAGRRIGRVLALEAARAGYDVVIHHHQSAEEAEGVAEEVRGLGRHAVTAAADLADAASLSALTRAAISLGPLTLLVNNASLFLDDAVGALKPDLFDAHQAINLRAPVLLAEALAAALPRGKRGLVVNIIDQRVLRPDPSFFSYAVSKAGLHWATQTLAQALAPMVRVNGIGPGPTLPSIHQAPGEFEAEAQASLLARPVPPQALAQALRYLIDAEFVTGQMIAVDSGQHLSFGTLP
jgi:NAD(P)-dependent dehydrogenase (short-subunit alcohol dehydrogenase family)